VWKEAGLKPHRIEHYLASDDPDFESKAADIIDLYLNPPQHAAVFCADEKTAIQALDRLDPELPLRRAAPNVTGLIETWFSKVERDVIARGIFTSVKDLARKLRRYINAYSANAKPIQWKYSDPTRRIRSNVVSATSH
jgi:hypothetical protein